MTQFFDAWQTLSLFAHSSYFTRQLPNYYTILGLQPDSPENFNNINYNPIGSPASFPMGSYPNGPGYGAGMDPTYNPSFDDFETSTINISDIGDILGIATSMNFPGGGSGMDTN